MLVQTETKSGLHSVTRSARKAKQIGKIYSVKNGVSNPPLMSALNLARRLTHVETRKSIKSSMGY